MSFECIGKFKDRQEAFSAVGASVVYEDSTSWRRTSEEGRKHDSACSYQVFSDGRGGMVFNWRRGISAVWFDGVEWSSLSKRAKREYEEKMLEARREAEEEERRRHERAAAVARAIWNECAPAVTVGHAYLRRKGVRPVDNLGVLDAESVGRIVQELTGERWRQVNPKTHKPMSGPLLVVPCFRGGKPGEISSLEFIAEDGGKTCLKGGRTKGAFWVPSDLESTDGPLCIAEGIATALSISQVLRVPCVAGRSCGNLEDVARWLWVRFPDRKIVVFGDRGNGEAQAAKAAECICAALAVPNFDALTPGGETVRAAFARLCPGVEPTDFNDFYLATGQLYGAYRYD